MFKSISYLGCQNEQQFKMQWLKAHELSKIVPFCIETEETVKGFPDVLCIDKVTKQVHFLEFKFTKSGKIKFQPTQPAFYKKHYYLPIKIVAYNAKTLTVHYIMKEDLFQESSAYKMNEKSEVNLSKVENARYSTQEVLSHTSEEDCMGEKIEVKASHNGEEGVVEVWLA